MFYKGLLKEHMLVLSWLAKLIDLLLFLVSGLLAFYFQFQHLYFDRLYIAGFAFAALLVLPIFSFFNVYKSFLKQNLLKYLGSLYLAIISVMALLAAIAFITKTGSYFSRAWFCIWIANTTVLLTIFRLLLWHILRIIRKYGWNQRRVVVIGTGTLGQSLIEHIRKAFWSGFKVADVFDDNPSQNKKGFICGISVKKTPSNMEEYVRKNAIDEVWIALPLKAESKIEEIVKALRQDVITIRYFPDMFSLDLLNYSVTEIFGMSAINIVSSPMIGINRIVKAIEDRVLALLILLFLSPFMLIIAILVKLSSPGAIFFRQERIGWNGKKFNMLKFRSMPVDAEINTGAIWAHEKDNRATKFGSFLRKTSLDELPQFINVLRGDMSIVGPRPERSVFVDKFKYDIPNYMQKHLVKAGITGWAQVNGWRGNTSLEKRIEYDLYYIENWSFWLDMKIILLTLVKGFVHKNAY
jgi:putative colanic acid biosynthesis UDP-glucose lipid carrier transferase